MQLLTVEWTQTCPSGHNYNPVTPSTSPHVSLRRSRQVAPSNRGVVWCGVVWCGVVWCSHLTCWPPCHGDVTPSSGALLPAETRLAECGHGAVTECTSPRPTGYSSGVCVVCQWVCVCGGGAHAEDLQAAARGRHEQTSRRHSGSCGVVLTSHTELW